MADLNLLKVCSFNASGLRNRQKLNTLLNYFKTNKADIVFLQETHLVQEDKDYISRVWGGEVHLSGENRNSKGIITLFSKNIKREDISLISFSDRCIVSCLNTKGDRKYLLINIY